MTKKDKRPKGLGNDSFFFLGHSLQTLIYKGYKNFLLKLISINLLEGERWIYGL